MFLYVPMVDPMDTTNAAKQVQRSTILYYGVCILEIFFFCTFTSLFIFFLNWVIYLFVYFHGCLGLYCVLLHCLMENYEKNGNEFCLKKIKRVSCLIHTEENNLAPLKKKTSNWWLNAKKLPLHTTSRSSRGCRKHTHSSSNWLK